MCTVQTRPCLVPSTPPMCPSTYCRRAQLPACLPLALLSGGLNSSNSGRLALLMAVSKLNLLSHCSAVLLKFMCVLRANVLVVLCCCCRPARGDWVGLVGETFGDSSVRAMRQRMRDSPIGQQILADRPRVTVRKHALVSGGMCQESVSVLVTHKIAFDAEHSSFCGGSFEPLLRALCRQLAAQTPAMD